jgi:hypothetical protein
MVLRQRVTDFLPVIVAKIAEKATIKVDVLIPPPVDPEDAPINIKNIRINKVGILNKPKSTVSKPAVLHVTD